jgi:hypothetical protein
MGDEHPDGYSSTRNFHICNARVRTMTGSRPDGWSRISNFILWWTRVRTTAVRRPDGDIWIAILALRRRVSGRDTTSSGRLIDLFPFLELGKKSKTDRVLGGVWTCCWNVRTDASWIEPSRHSGGSGQRDTSSGWMMLGLSGVRTDGTVTDGSPNEMARSSGRLTGNLNSSDLQTLNNGIHVYNIFTLNWFCSNTEWGQNTNKLPLWPFWDKNHLTGLEIHSRSKIKITPPFCHKGTKGQTE